jgi:hypothetical protein
MSYMDYSAMITKIVIFWRAIIWKAFLLFIMISGILLNVYHGLIYHDIYSYRFWFGLIFLMIFIYFIIVSIVPIKIENDSIYIMPFLSWKQLDPKSIFKLNEDGLKIYVKNVQYFNILKIYYVPWPTEACEPLIKYLRIKSGLIKRGEIGSTLHITHKA